jgi:hypothetical protein
MAPALRNSAWRVRDTPHDVMRCSEICRENGSWMELTQDSIQGQALVLAVLSSASPSAEYVSE